MALGQQIGRGTHLWFLTGWHGNRALLVSPTEVIARNQTLATLLDRLAEDLGRDLTELMAENRAFSFRARQFFVRLGPGPRSVEMLRGSELVDLKAVTRERVQQFEREMSQWMLNNVQRDGRMTYMCPVAVPKRPGTT